MGAGEVIGTVAGFRVVGCGHESCDEVCGLGEFGSVVRVFVGSTTFVYMEGKYSMH